MIDYIACIILAFALLQLLVALVNLLFRERLPAHNKNGEDKMSTTASMKEPTLSLMIPARNEEANIGRLLSGLTSINDRIREIIVCDDQSTDRTAEIVETFAASDSRIRLIRCGELPDGWYGKTTPATAWHRRQRVTTSFSSMPMCG